MKKFRAHFATILVILLVSQPLATSADCTTKACIDVYIEGDKIVIDGKRAGATTKPRVLQSSVPIPKPTIRRPTNTAPAIKRSYKPRTTTPSARRSSTSLADKILQSLPTLQVAYQPEGKVLQKVPVIFFTDLPSQFNKDFKILGVPVRINVKPRSLWNFGDGTTLLTSKPGRPYPATDITHSYSVPGTYIVSVATIWSGSFTVSGITKEIPGAIRQVSAVDIKVVGASTKFVGK